MITGQKIEINGLQIWYTKVGHGSKVVLLIPGSCGTAESDFLAQLENFDRDKFTLIAWDPPGYGHSRPPVRRYNLEQTYFDDAQIAFELMSKLGFKTFSLIGWSEGGITALVMAFTKPDTIESMVIFGASTYMTPYEKIAVQSFQDVSKWSSETLSPYLRSYTRSEFQEMWTRHVQFLVSLKDIGREKVKLITCPVLLFIGGRDALCPKEHNDFLKKNIPNISVHVFPNGGHNVHISHFKEFNELSQKFFLQGSLEADFLSFYHSLQFIMKADKVSKMVKVFPIPKRDE